MIVRFLLSIFVLLAALPLQAAVPEFSARLEIDRHAVFLEDISDSLTLQDVTAPGNVGRFKPLAENSPFNRGITSSAWWVRITLAPRKAPEGSKSPLLLEIPYAPLDRVQFFQPLPDGRVIHMRSGDQFSFNTRPIRHYTSVFPIVINDNSATDIFLRVKSDGNLRIPLTLWENDAFFAHAQTQLVVFGLYFGMLALIFLFNLLFYAWLRDTNFLYYILYVGTLAIFQGAYTGLGFEFIWEDYPMFNAYAVVMGLQFVNVFALMFARRVLKLATILPDADRMLRWLQVCSIVCIPACLLLPYSIMLHAGTLMSLCWAVALIAVSSITAARGHRSSQLFITAWLVFLAGGVALAAVTLGWLPANPLTVNGLLIGSAIETILLSVMLADRVHNTERDKTRSEQKAKVALQAVNRALMESNRVKDEFLATISHEMRTPMNGILQCMGHIRTEKTREKFIEFIDSAEDSAQNLMNLIESVLSYTELQTHEFRIHQDPFRLSRMLGDLRETYTRAAQQKGLTLTFVVSEQVPPILIGDRRRLSQILTNLIDNGIKFTAQGHVRLTIDVASIDQQSRQVHLVFSVKDTGVGIPSGMENVVFDRFRQLTASRSRQHGGLGIGLAVCKQIATLMGADLRYRSLIGEGTEFLLTIALPYSEQDLPRPELLTDPGDRDTTRLILVVEDNPVNQLVLKTSLIKLGFNVLCANNGEEGVAMVQQYPIDLVLMDCQMPVMDGYEATRRIRDLPAPKSLVPIIAITANAMSRDRDACIECGMNDYLSKPTNSRTLNETMCKWIPGMTEDITA